VWLASKGNKVFPQSRSTAAVIVTRLQVEVLSPLLYSLVMAAFSVIGNVFWLLWQT
jgi:hypothetical protein